MLSKVKLKEQVTKYYKVQSYEDKDWGTQNDRGCKFNAYSYSTKTRDIEITEVEYLKYKERYKKLKNYGANIVKICTKKEYRTVDILTALEEITISTGIVKLRNYMANLQKYLKEQEIKVAELTNDYKYSEEYKQEQLIVYADEKAYIIEKINKITKLIDNAKEEKQNKKLDVVIQKAKKEYKKLEMEKWKYSEAYYNELEAEILNKYPEINKEMLNV